MPAHNTAAKKAIALVIYASLSWILTSIDLATGLRRVTKLRRVAAGAEESAA
jgi:hypothetical protein